MIDPAVTLSYEIFPPRDDAAEAALDRTLSDLAQIGAAYVSVTSGAGGTEAVGTATCARHVKSRYGLRTRPHVTCVQGSRAEAQALIEAYVAEGVRDFVAIRGDLRNPQGVYRAREDGFAFANTLVPALKSWGATDVAVGAYPESHPDSGGGEADLGYLKAKVDAGADRIITQYCFDTETVLRWRDRVRAAGIDLPIGVGIMPIPNFKQIKRFSERCGAGVPDWLVKSFDGVEPNTPLAHALAAGIAAEQCRRLIDEGFGQLHLYTLNRSALTIAVVRLLEAGPNNIRWAA